MTTMKSKTVGYAPSEQEKRACRHLNFRPERTNGPMVRGMHMYRLLLDGGNDSGCYIPEGNSISRALDYALYWMRQKLIWTAILEVSNIHNEKVTEMVSIVMIDNRKKNV